MKALLIVLALGLFGATSAFSQCLPHEKSMEVWNSLPCTVTITGTLNSGASYTWRLGAGMSASTCVDVNDCLSSATVAITGGGSTLNLTTTSGSGAASATGSACSSSGLGAHAFALGFCSGPNQHITIQSDAL